MEREDIIRRIEGKEPEGNLNGTRVVVYRFEDEPEGDFKYHIVKESSDDSLSVFVEQETKATRDRIKELEEGKKDIKDRYGRSRSGSNITQIRKDKDREIRPLRQKLEILEGNVVYPLVFTKEDDEITGSNLSLTNRESSWWGYIKEKPEILELDNEDIQFLLRAFMVRHGLKYDPSSKELSDEWDEIREELREDKRKDDQLGPYLVDITKRMTS